MFGPNEKLFTKEIEVRLLEMVNINSENPDSCSCFSCVSSAAANNLVKSNLELESCSKVP